MTDPHFQNMERTARDLGRNSRSIYAIGVNLYDDEVIDGE